MAGFSGRTDRSLADRMSGTGQGRVARGRATPCGKAQCSVLSAQCSVLSAQCSSAQCSVLVLVPRQLALPFMPRRP